jgi:MFS family permease
VEVKRAAVVSGQPWTRGPGEQAVEHRGEFGRPGGREDRSKVGPGVARIGQIVIVHDDRLRLLMRQEKRPQVAGGRQGIAVPIARRAVHQGDREAGPSGRSERRLSAHGSHVTVFDMKAVTHRRGERGTGRLPAATRQHGERGTGRLPAVTRQRGERGTGRLPAVTRQHGERGTGRLPAATRQHGKRGTGRLPDAAQQRGRRGIGALLAAALTARLADQGAALGVTLVILARTHSPPLAGFVVGAFSFPTLITGPVIGAWLDRLSAKRVLFVANQAILTASLVAIGALAGRAPGIVLVLLALAAGLTGPVITGGFTSLVPLLVPPGRLTRANVADSATYDLSGLAGPAMVAVAAGVAGPGGGLATVAAVSGVGIVLALLAPMPSVPGRRSDETVARAIADGMRLLVRKPLLAATTMATTVTQLPEGMLPVALPLLAVAAGGHASSGGWLLTAASAGALCGTAVSGRLLDAAGPRGLLVGAMAASAPLLAALALVPPFVPGLVVTGLFGVATGPILAATFTVRQRDVPAGRYAQIAATAASLKTGAYAIGAAIAGVVVAAIGVRSALLCAAAVQVAAIAPLILPVTRAAEPGPGRPRCRPHSA